MIIAVVGVFPGKKKQNLNNITVAKKTFLRKECLLEVLKVSSYY